MARKKFSKTNDFYLYILFDRKTCKPFYCGTTCSPRKRLKLHRHILKKKGYDFNIKMVLFGFINDMERAFDREKETIVKLVSKYGKSILNIAWRPRPPRLHNTCDCKEKNKYYDYDTYRLTYVPRVKWIFILAENKNNFYWRLKWGECSIISNLCNVSDERIRQIFIKRPLKIHPNIYYGIEAYRKKAKPAKR